MEYIIIIYILTELNKYILKKNDHYHTIIFIAFIYPDKFSMLPDKRII